MCMNRATYQKMTQPFRVHPKLAQSLHMGNRILTGLVFLSYFALLSYLLIRRSGTFVLSAAVPACGFLIVSALRVLLNRRRPYEKFDLPR